MVEAGQIEIGGTINVQGIEAGLTRVENSLELVATAGKSVNADFIRMNQQTERLGKKMGVLALAGAGAMIAIAKNAPGTAAAMAQISVSALKLKFAVGDAMAPAFDKFGEYLDNFSGWVDRHPNLFRGIVNSLVGLGVATAVLKVGGFVYKAWAGFFTLIKGMVAWTGWSKLFANLSKLGGGAGGAAGAGIAASMGVSGIVGAAAIPLIIETYRTRPGPGEGIYQEQVRETQRNIIYLNKVGTEREKRFLRRLFGTVKMDTY